MRKFKQGFTIIEILIVLVISSSFMALSVSQYRDFAQRQSLTVARRQVLSTLTAAQKDAISGRKPQGTPPCVGDLAGYIVQFNAAAGATSYTTFAECTAIPGPGVTWTNLKSENLPEGITAAIFPGPWAGVRFLPLSEGVSQATNIVLTSTDTGQTITISISSYGRID